MSRLPLIPLGSFLFPQTRSALGSVRTSAPAFYSSAPHLLLRHHHAPAPLPLYPWFTTRLPPPLLPTPFLYPAPFFGRSSRPLCSADGWRMEQREPERELEREPPHKRRKSSEEKTVYENSEGRTNCQLQKRNRDLREKSVKHPSRETSREKKGQKERTKNSGDNMQSQQRTLGKECEVGQKEQVDGSAAQTVSSVGALQRHWEQAPPHCSDHPPPPGVSAGFDFTVMSYNILSQDLLRDNAYLYQHCPPEVLTWDYRLPRLLREIQAHDADILCLQEVQEDHFVEQIRPALEALGYQCEYKKRTGHKPDGCAVVFKTSRLSLLSSDPVEFFRRGDALLDRDNVGLVVRLSPSSDPASSICVANTHLLYNPRRGDIKLAQLAILLAEVNRVSRLPDGSTNPVLLCGDLNSTPWSPLYRFLTTGHLDYQGMPIAMVSGQESFSRTQRLLCCPLWSHTLGINSSCQYQEQSQDQTQDHCRPQGDAQKTSGDAAGSPSVVEGAISDLTVDDEASKPTQDVYERGRLSHSLKLQSSYNHRLSPDGRDEITTCHSRTAVTVDYILYTPDSPGGPSPSFSSSLPRGRGLQLLGRLSLVGHSELEQVNGLPNHSHSSDHLPLLARFRLRR